jgi:hypothetical protein
MTTSPDGEGTAVAQKLRTAATMAALTALLIAGAYFGWSGMTEGWLGDDGTATAENGPTESCSTPAPVTVLSRRVRVSVYNAGAPAGQATEVMAALGDQGFIQGVLTDAPAPIAVRGIVLWPGKADDEAVKLVRRQFRKARVAPERRALGPGINVMVGQEFGDLARNAPRRIEVPQPEVCRPVT